MANQVYSSEKGFDEGDAERKQETCGEASEGSAGVGEEPNEGDNATYETPVILYDSSHGTLVYTDAFLWCRDCRHHALRCTVHRDAIELLLVVLLQFRHHQHTDLEALGSNLRDMMNTDRLGGISHVWKTAYGRI